MEAGKRTISEIFNGSRVLQIPFFQRSYVWDKEQWQRMIDDLLEVSIVNKPYFLGSVILKQQETTSSASSGDVRTLIDGQQRLTTLNIFFKVLALKQDRGSDFDSYFKLRRDKRIALEHNHNDIEAFTHIVNLEEMDYLPNPEVSYCHIKGAYNYFVDNVDETQFDFFNVIDNLMFVGIDLNRDEEEQQIFDTINSLGVRLTTAELLKNHLFGRDDLASYELNWKEVFEKDAETKGFWDREITAGRVKRENIDLFFFAYLQIKLQDKQFSLKTEEKKRLGKFSGLFENYKEFMKITGLDKDEMIAEIKQYAELYRQFIDYDVVDRELTDDFGIERINAIIFGLDSTVLIPYVLYVLKNADEHLHESIFQYLEAYMMRRIIVKATNKNYNNLFSDTLITNAANTVEKLKELIELKSEHENAMPSDDDVEKGFYSSKLINKQTTGILYLMESRIRDKRKHSTALLGLDRYSLEHLMPKKWVNNWEAVEDEQKKYERNSKLLTLGNLAIITTSLNTSIRDASWDIKKNGKANRKGLKEYSSGLETIGKFLEYEDWNESTIDERAGFLYEQSKDVWAI